MAILRKCCCCFSLDTGGLVLGAMGLLGSGAILISSGIMFYLATDVPDKMGDMVPENYRNSTIMTSILGQYLALLLIVCAIISGTCALMLVCGVIKMRRGFMVPYLITEGIQCIYVVFHVLFMIYATLMLPTGGKKPESIDMVFRLSVASVFAAVKIYLWVCIHSLYQSYAKAPQQDSLVQLEDNNFSRESPYSQLQIVQGSQKQ